MRRKSRYKKLMIRKDSCSPVFIVALFTATETQKQAECPSVGEWIQKTRYLEMMEYYSAMKKVETMPFAAT